MAQYLWHYGRPGGQAGTPEDMGVLVMYAIPEGACVGASQPACLPVCVHACVSL